MKTFVSFLFFISVLAQGGFYPRVHIFFGLLCTAIIIFPCLKIFFRLESIILAAVSLLYILSTFVTGFSIDVLLMSIHPLTVLMFLLIIFNLKFDDRLTIIKNICIFTIVISLVAIISYTGLFNIPGNQIANRLQFTFQYANVAGIYFAAIALAMHHYSDEKLGCFIPIVETPLLLTQSIGAICCYMFGLASSIFLKYKHKGDKVKTLELIAQSILSLVISSLIAIAIYIIKIKTSLYLLCLVPVAVLLSICINYKKIIDFILKHNIYKPLFAALPILILPVFLTPRWQRGILTLIERIIQITDSYKAVKHNLLFGLGPGNWEILKPHWQTAYYSASIVHSSYMQIAVDAGILALFLTVSIVVFFLFKARKGDPYFVSCILIILLHSTLDFSLSFLSINLLMVIFYSCISKSNQQTKSFKKIYCIIPVILICMFFGYLLWVQVQIDKAKIYSKSGNYINSNLIFEKSPLLLKGSYRNQILYTANLYHMKLYDKALDMLNRLPYNTTEKIYVEASILEKRGKYDQAAYKLLEGIALMPFEKPLHDYLQDLINTKLNGDIKEKVIGEYRRVVNIGLRKQNKLARFIHNEFNLSGVIETQ